MFRFFEFLVFFLIGYKIIRMVFAEIKPQQKVRSSTQNHNINSNTYQQRTAPIESDELSVVSYQPNFVFLHY